MPASRTYVAVCGASEANAEQLHAAEVVGRLLAERGAVVVCGGLGGVTEAASRGATEAGGTVVGLLPGESREPANPHLTLAIITKTMFDIDIEADGAQMSEAMQALQALSRSPALP